MKLHLEDSGGFLCLNVVETFEMMCELTNMKNKGRAVSTPVNIKSDKTYKTFPPSTSDTVSQSLFSLYNSFDGHLQL